MPYRDDLEALQVRCDQIHDELQEVRRQSQDMEALKARQSELERDLADARRRLDGARRALPVLENVRVASPCNADWAEMRGDDRVRFCGKCEKNVYNLSAMTRIEAEALVREREGAMCVRLAKRVDGTVLTEDCPVGARLVRRRRLILATVTGGALVAVGMVGTILATRTMGAMPPPQMIQGGMMIAPSEPVRVPVQDGVRVPGPAPEQPEQQIKETPIQDIAVTQGVMLPPPRQHHPKRGHQAR